MPALGSAGFHKELGEVGRKVRPDCPRIDHLLTDHGFRRRIWVVSVAQQFIEHHADSKQIR